MSRPFSLGLGRRTVLLAALSLMAVASLPARAPATQTASSEAGAPDVVQPLAQPTGDVVLTISGVVARTNAAGIAKLDLAMLEAMPAVTFTTQTIWTKGDQTFVGVSLNELVDTLGIDAQVLGASAINDYRVDIPISDAVEEGPMIAYKMNGEYMSRRGKGPLWIVYPYDSNPDFRKEAIYNRSIWQLDRLSAE